MYGGLADIYQSSEHGARPTRNLRLPGGGEYPAAQRASPSPRTRSRARRGPRICHPGRLREQGGAGRGRTGPGAADPGRARSAHPLGWRRYNDTWLPILSGRGARAHWDGRGTTIHAMDIEGASRRSHELTAVRTDLGLGWPESTHRWTGTTCRAASLDCSEWSEERDAGRALLDRVEGGD